MRAGPKWHRVGNSNFWVNLLPQTDKQEIKSKIKTKIKSYIYKQTKDAVKPSRVQAHSILNSSINSKLNSIESKTHVLISKVSGVEKKQNQFEIPWKVMPDQYNSRIGIVFHLISLIVFLKYDFFLHIFWSLCSKCLQVWL